MKEFTLSQSYYFRQSGVRIKSQPVHLFILPRIFTVRRARKHIFFNQGPNSKEHQKKQYVKNICSCDLYCSMSKQRQKSYVSSFSFTNTSERIKKKKSNSVALATDSFSVILLASGLATAFLSLDEIIQEKPIKEGFIHTEGSPGWLSYQVLRAELQWPPKMTILHFKIHLLF